MHTGYYLDDLIVYSLTWSEHLQTLTEVFSRLTNTSLTLNLAKCGFRKRTATCLGRQAKFTAITEFPVPATRHALRQFLGMTGYYWSLC